MTKIRVAIHFTLTLAVGLMLSSASHAAVVFSSDFDSGAGMAVVADADTEATFGFDYSAHGIPEAPNSVGGAATTGLKMRANILGDPVGTGVAAETAAVTTGLGTLSGQYTMQVDIWTNFSLEDPSGNTTEFAGAGVGHDGVATGRDGASLFYTGDGGSSRDYRLFKGTGEQFFASLQYGPALASNNGSDPAISAAITGQSAPAAQGQAGTSDDGDSAFQWLTLLAEVDTNAIGSNVTDDPGTAKFTLTSAATGMSVEIGTIDNSNGGGAVNMSGNVSLLYGDIFSSLNGVPDLQFGIFDNLVVTVVPEPASLLLMSFGSLALLGRRRR